MTARRRTRGGDRSGPGREGKPRPRLENANPDPTSGRPGSAPELAHEVALLIDGDGEREGMPREIRAPALQEECGGDPGHPLAREAISHSKAGRLRCPVCGSVVERVFPSPESKIERWHFRRRKGEGECDHEGETVAHRDSKTALAEALRATLPDGWEVHLERRLENGRRPDVLAVHAETGDRVAFEVQYADISRAMWRKRHADYASLGVRDYWLLGAEKRYAMRSDDLAALLEGESGQRIIYIGRFEPGGPIELEELALSYLDPEAPRGMEDLPVLAPPADLASLPPERLRNLAVAPQRLPYPLEDLGLRLGPRGPDFLTTPLDLHNLRREQAGLLLAEAERERLEREAAAEADREQEISRVLARWRQAQEAWLGSQTRRRAVEELGPDLVEGLEREVRTAAVGATEGALRRVCRSGGWRVVFYLAAVFPLPPGETFLWSEARDGYLASNKRRPPRTPGATSPAWADLRRQLIEEERVVPVGADLLTVPVPPDGSGDPVRQARGGSEDAESSTLGGRLKRLFGRFF